MAAASAAGAFPVGAQAAGPSLAPKRFLTLPAVPACLRAAAVPRAARRDELGARAAAAQARELALVGDRAGARAAFARAVSLDPAAPGAAYDLGRASEEVNDAGGAVAAYCHLLGVAPGAADAGDARARVARLAGGADAGAERRARGEFAAGLAALDARRYELAAAAFGAVLRSTPNAPEAAYDRGLALLALGRDADAARDLAAYVASPASNADRGEVLRAVDALRRPAWRPGVAFARGLAPGFGQLYTGRPALGVGVLAASAASVALAFTERTRVRDERFVDEFGNPYTSPVTTRSRPYVGPGLATAALLAVGGALEAAHFARRARRARPVVTLRTAAAGGGGRGAGRTLALGLRAAF